VEPRRAGRRVAARERCRSSAAARATERGTEFDGRVKWETAVTPYTAEDTDPDLEKASESLATRLYRVTCEVRYVGGDGKERALSLATTRVGARNPA
jgi:hypothetical protein